MAVNKGLYSAYSHSVSGTPERRWKVNNMQNIMFRLVCLNTADHLNVTADHLRLIYLNTADHCIWPQITTDHRTLTLALTLTLIPNPNRSSAVICGVQTDQAQVICGDLQWSAVICGIQADRVWRYRLNESSDSVCPLKYERQLFETVRLDTLKAYSPKVDSLTGGTVNWLLLV